MSRPQCRNCMERVDVTYPASRYGGGTYRRPGRWYRSSICGPCAEYLMTYATDGRTSQVARWGISGLRRAQRASILTRVVQVGQNDDAPAR